MKKVRDVDLPNCGNGPPCDGGCIEAAVATITGLDPALIPCTDALHAEQKERAWWERLADALRPQGWHFYWWPNDPPFRPPGLAIASGPDAVDGSDHHAVVARDGEIIFDPSGKVGIQQIEFWYMLAPLVDEEAA